MGTIFQTSKIFDFREFRDFWMAQFGLQHFLVRPQLSPLIFQVLWILNTFHPDDSFSLTTWLFSLKQMFHLLQHCGDRSAISSQYSRERFCEYSRQRSHEHYCALLWMHTCRNVRNLPFWPDSSRFLRLLGPIETLSTFELLVVLIAL